MRKLKSLTLCLDMHGCPNRCLHCWLGHDQNANMGEADLRCAAEAFRPFAKQLEVFSWYREPDFPGNYRELWALEAALSDKKTPHFENMSVWRAARDPDYVPWLKRLGLKACQLTVFGGEALTDKYTGRKGAYRDILRGMELLQKNDIQPRIQAFVNQETIAEMHLVDELLRAHQIELAFAHQGACSGANAALYDILPTPETLEHMPPLLTALSLKHWKAKSLQKIFGETEQALYQKLSRSGSTRSFVTDRPVLYIGRSWGVYPNVSAPAPHWRLGNLKRDGAEAIVACYLNENSPAQAARRNVPLGEMARACGDPAGQGLFCRGDYEEYILNQYCERELHL
ncbi:MAG: radical SAM protein [Oscillospiraceae bacterium]|nr:radical SAM protein [Oscillospiraceae bacterium]